MHCGNCQQEIKQSHSTNLLIHMRSNKDCCSDDFNSTKAIPETVEQEMERVWGTCGGKCGELQCIAYNKIKKKI